VDRRNRVQLVQEGGYCVACTRDTAGNDVPAGTVAVVRSPDFLRAPERTTALATLIHQRRLTPSCGGHAPTAKRTLGPARMIVESLTPGSGIREHYRHNSDFAECSLFDRFWVREACYGTQAIQGYRGWPADKEAPNRWPARIVRRSLADPHIVHQHRSNN
jgi:hypothetical protein